MTDNKRKMVSSDEVWVWPEWRAIEDKLGIPVGSTWKVQITLEMDQPVQVVANLFGTVDHNE